MVQAKVQEMHKELVDAGLGYSGYRQGQAKEIRKYDPLRLEVTSLKLNNCPSVKLKQVTISTAQLPLDREAHISSL